MVIKPKKYAVLLQRQTPKSRHIGYGPLPLGLWPLGKANMGYGFTKLIKALGKSAIENVVIGHWWLPRL